MAAVLKYVEYVQQSAFANASIKVRCADAVCCSLSAWFKITFRALEGFLHVDTETISNLELIRNSRSGDGKASLFGVLNHTCTAPGARLLRTSVRAAGDLGGGWPRSRMLRIAPAAALRLAYD